VRPAPAPAGRPRPVIVTKRSAPRRSFVGSEAERIASLAEAACLGAESSTWRPRRHHLSRRAPPSLRYRPDATDRLVARLLRHPGDRVLEERLALAGRTNARSSSSSPWPATKGTTSDAGPDPRARAQARDRGLLQGDPGRISRVMAPLFGSAFSYAPLAGHRPRRRGS
jgi:hypothetical protein